MSVEHSATCTLSSQAVCSVDQSTSMNMADISLEARSLLKNILNNDAIILESGERVTGCKWGISTKRVYCLELKFEINSFDVEYWIYFPDFSETHPVSLFHLQEQTWVTGFRFLLSISWKFKNRLNPQTDPWMAIDNKIPRFDNEESETKKSLNSIFPFLIDSIVRWFVFIDSFTVVFYSMSKPVFLVSSLLVLPFNLSVRNKQF